LRDPARGSELGHHARHINVADLQPSLAAEPVFDVKLVKFRFSELSVIRNTSDEFSTHSRDSS
jgi:hypothetical protein